MKLPTPPTKFRLVVLLGIAAACCVPAHATLPSPSLQRRIDALLKRRLKPEPLPVNPPNPFQVTSGAKYEVSSEDVATKPAIEAAPAAAEIAPKETSAAETLVTCAQRLKLGGIIVVKNQIQIVVNGVARREGDTIAADWSNSIIYLRIARLLPGQLTLTYGDAEVTVKF